VGLIVAVQVLTIILTACFWSAHKPSVPVEVPL